MDKYSYIYTEANRFSFYFFSFHHPCCFFYPCAFMRTNSYTLTTTFGLAEIYDRIIFFNNMHKQNAYSFIASDNFPLTLVEKLNLVHHWRNICIGCRGKNILSCELILCSIVYTASSNQSYYFSFT